MKHKGLSGLKGPKQLYLENNPIKDISVSKGLTQLMRIDLSGCQIADISPLAELVDLVWIDLRNNLVEDMGRYPDDP